MPTTNNNNNFVVSGDNNAALFTLKLHRGEGMALVAMNWKNGKPPKDFVGFAIEYKEPGGDKFFSLNNRLAFPGPGGAVDPNRMSTLRSPIQKFRWVHFPRNAELPGQFTYRVTPVFMDGNDKLSLGEPQQAKIVLMRETFPGKLNVTFSRGFVSSQAFVDRFQKDGHTISEIIPADADKGLTFQATHPDEKAALEWMGFEARNAILEVLDKAIADKTAAVRVVCYDLNEPEIVSRLEKLRKRVKVIIDDDGAHGKSGSAENQAEQRLVITAGRDNVKRQHLGKLQHNKSIAVNGTGSNKTVVCGSTNFSWRGFFVQGNNAVVIKGANAVKTFSTAFDHFFDADNSVKKFASTDSAIWNDLKITGVDVAVTFSPHNDTNKVLDSVAKEINDKTSSSLLYSLAFLYQTPGKMQDTILKLMKNKKIFVYGISDHKVGGLDVQIPDGNIAPVFSAALTKKDTPEPFRSEPTGGKGVRMHHKFVVVDFDKPTARVYLGSYNFSATADTKNGENLLLIKDRRVATSYMIEALRIFDHYHFRVTEMQANKARKKLFLKKPPRVAGEKAWWEEDFTDARKIKDRELFS